MATALAVCNEVSAMTLDAVYERPAGPGPGPGPGSGARAVSSAGASHGKPSVVAAEGKGDDGDGAGAGGVSVPSALAVLRQCGGQEVRRALLSPLPSPSIPAAEPFDPHCRALCTFPTLPCSAWKHASHSSPRQGRGFSLTEPSFTRAFAPPHPPFPYPYPCPYPCPCPYPYPYPCPCRR